MLTCSIIEPAISSSRPLFLGITNTTYETQCIHKTTLYYQIKNAALSLHFRIIKDINSRPCNNLLQYKKLNISSTLISFIELSFNSKHYLTARSLLQTKSKLLYNISLTQICADLPLGSIRQQIQQINCQLPIVGYLQASVSLHGLCCIQRSLRQLLIK